LAFVKKSFNKFNTIKEFEECYLDYSSGLLDVLKKEFEKVPSLRGKLENLLA